MQCWRSSSVSVLITEPFIKDDLACSGSIDERRQAKQLFIATIFDNEMLMVLNKEGTMSLRTGDNKEHVFSKY